LERPLSRRRLLSLALLAAIALLMALKAVATRDSAARTVGITLEADPPGIVRLTEVASGGPAARAGLQAGDSLSSIAGVRLVEERDYDRIARGYLRGSPVSFEVQRGEQRVEVLVRPGIPFPWTGFLLDLLVALAYGSVALLSLQQRTDLRARLLALFAFTVVLEFTLPLESVGQPQLELLMTPVWLLLIGAQMGLELHLASVIPQRQGWVRPGIIWGYYGFGIGLGALAALAHLGEALRLPLAPWSASHASLALFSVAMPLWALAVPALLARPALLHPEPRGRHQAGLVLAGVLPWAAVVMIGAGHELLGAVRPAWLDPAFTWVLLCYPVAVFVAIFRYQLFDIESMVRRGLLYTTLTTSLLLVFYAALGAGGVLFSELVEPGRSSMWAVAAATLLLGLLFTPLRRWLEGEIYRRFFPDRLALRQLLTALAGELPALGKLPLMGAHLVRRMCEILRTRWATLLIADPQSGLLVGLASSRHEVREGLEQSLLLSPEDAGLRLLTATGRPFPARQLAARSPALGLRLERLQAQVVVPLCSHDRLVGLVLLGPKEREDRYQAEEMELLALFGHHLATVLENARLFESATRDGLTGLLRREAVLEQLEHELQRAQRYDRPLTVGLADLDHFKDVNDRHGHLAGDAALKWVARVLAQGLRATDFIGRYGGEEFLLILPETDLDGAVSVAEKVRGLVEQERMALEGGDEISLTLSIGLTSLSDFEQRPVAIVELIAQADRSLYRAKEAGRNQVRPSVA
jgi:diguanylate cyclase (GGDEF)-like protein